MDKYDAALNGIIDRTYSGIAGLDLKNLIRDGMEAAFRLGQESVNQSTPATVSDSRSNLIDVNAAAEILGLKVQTLAAWRLRGRGPKFVRMGRRILYRPAALNAFVAVREFSNTAEADAAGAKRSKR